MQYFIIYGVILRMNIRKNYIFKYSGYQAVYMFTFYRLPEYLVYLPIKNMPSRTEQ